MASKITKKLRNFIKMAKEQSEHPGGDPYYDNENWYFAYLYFKDLKRFSKGEIVRHADEYRKYIDKRIKGVCCRYEIFTLQEIKEEVVLLGDLQDVADDIGGLDV
jgi:hypothetical protein